MPKQVDKLLADIVLASDAIMKFANGRSRESLDTDLMLSSAIERQLMIVGEAIRQLRDLDIATALMITDYKRIIEFRNVLAHGYDNISEDIVWQVVTEKLPILLAEVRTIQAARSLG